MAIINVLDKHTAELIAAGEVVERPASVVKELIENSIDAGSTSITVHIENGGISLIQIADNGTGIEHEYIKVAFIRHATSKIKTQEDLENIGTLGFRGEALASICSVAKVELLTKTENDEFAALYTINAGQEVGIEPAARPVGTTFTVKDLFYNTPARLKFLKKDSSEANYISDVIIHSAISNPNIAFKYYKDNKLQFQTTGDGNVKSAAHNVLSKDFAKTIVEIDNTDKIYTVKGYVSLPQNSRASRAMQFFFVNGRYVKNATMTAALEAAYKGMVMSAKFPGCILFLTLPAELVDVNVHPAKTQVRFAREKDVFSAIYKAVKCAILPAQVSQNLTQENSEKTNETNDEDSHVGQNINQNNDKVLNYDFTTQQSVDMQQEKAQAQSINNAANTNNTQQRFSPVTAKPTTIFPDDIEPVAIEFTSDMSDVLSTDVKITYKAVQEDAFNKNDLNDENNKVIEQKHKEKREENETIENDENDISQLALFENENGNNYKELKYVGEIFNTYIIMQTDEEMCIIDKHAAHERLLYEKLIATYKNVSSQMLLHPISVQLSANEKNALLSNEELLLNSGIEIEDFGGNSVILRAVPADIYQADLENFVIELADKLTLNSKDAMSEKTQWVLHSISCRAAIKGGDKNSSSELFLLAQDIMSGKAPLFCPHGRPVIIKMTKKEVERQFGRQG